MVDRYVILNKEGGWLENIVLWDGNTQTWQPPVGTIAKKIKEIKIEELPPNPQNNNL